MSLDSPEAALRLWVEKAVVGLNLCPFAAPVLREGGLGIEISSAKTAEEAVRASLAGAVSLLDERDGGVTTLLLAFPHALDCFEEFLDVIATVEEELSRADARGVLQVATFHPAYCFDGAAKDDLGNWTNRAPFPVVHFLREDDVERAIAEHPDPQGIPAENVRRLHELGEETLLTIWSQFQSGNR